MAHAHHHGPDHVPHVAPMKVYIGTWLALMFLTFVTVAVSYVDLGRTVNMILALFIATTKATLVCAFFMHLLHDHKFHTVTFLSSIVFLIIFLVFTMFDTEARGRVDPLEKERPAVVSDPFGLNPEGATDAAAGAEAPADGAAPAEGAPAEEGAGEPATP